VAIDRQPEFGGPGSFAERLGPHLDPRIAAVTSRELRGQSGIRLERHDPGLGGEPQQEVEHEPAIGADVEDQGTGLEPEQRDRQEIRLDRPTAPPLAETLDGEPRVLREGDEDLDRADELAEADRAPPGARRCEVRPAGPAPRAAGR
jgi:hypothetical protein